MLNTGVGLTTKLAEMSKRFQVAELGGFEGGFWKFLFNPEIAQKHFEVGLEKVQYDPNLMDNWWNNIFKKNS